jgi:hypothetical protein
MAWKALIVGAMLGAAACSASAPAVGEEVQKVRSGDLEIALLSREATLKQGEDAFTLEFRKAGTTTPVDVGTVKVSATMPMSGRAPMMADAVVAPAGTPGRYTVTTRLTMAGTWNLGVEWQGPAGAGKAALSASAQ